MLHRLVLVAEACITRRPLATNCVMYGTLSGDTCANVTPDTCHATRVTCTCDLLPVM